MNTKNESSNNGQRGNTTESHEKRVEAGHKAAETRKENGTDKGNTTESHEKRVEAGRKGGEARAEQMREDSSNSNSGSSNSGNSGSKGNKGGNSESESTHEKRVEAGRKGGEARAEQMKSEAHA